ncbi:hypothetical protein DI09_138p10, partial [Mitosporidium daphniae]
MKDLLGAHLSLPVEQHISKLEARLSTIILEQKELFQEPDVLTEIRTCKTQPHDGLEAVFSKLQQESTSLSENIRNIQSAIVDLERQKAQVDGYAFLDEALESLIDVIENVPSISFPIARSRLSESMKILVQSKKAIHRLGECKYLSPAIAKMTTCIESLERFLLFEPQLAEEPLEDFVSWYQNVTCNCASILLLEHSFIPFSNQKRFVLEMKDQIESASLVELITKLCTCCENSLSNIKFIQLWIQKTLSKAGDDFADHDHATAEKYASLLMETSLALDGRKKDLIHIISSKLDDVFIEEDKIPFFSTLIAYQQKQCQLLKSSLLVIQEDHIPSIIQKIWSFSELFRKNYISWDILGIPISNSQSGSVSFDPVRSSLLSSFSSFEVSVKDSIKLTSNASINGASGWKPGDAMEPTLAKVIFQEATNWHLVVSSKNENPVLNIPIFIINGCHICYLLNIFIALAVGEYFPPSFIFSAKRSKESMSFPRILLPSTSSIQEAINAASSLPDVILNELVCVRIFPVKSWLPSAIKKAKWKQSEV